MSLLSTVEAARAAHVTPERIRDWKRRHLLVPAEYDRRGWPLYRVTDVLLVERRTHADHRGHRRPLEPPRDRLRQLSVVERFWAYTMRGNPEDCWLWASVVNNSGYGRFSTRGRYVLAHRFSYELNKGPIPDGLQLDHLCRTPLCVNPDHLEPVTADENQRRAYSARRLAE